jgi:hypothetical protein
MRQCATTPCWATASLRRRSRASGAEIHWQTAVEFDEHLAAASV